jgi:hypothetical protein
MPLELNWIPSSRASCLHAAAAACRGERLIDARLTNAIAEPAAAIQREIDTAEIRSADFWQHLVPLSVGSESFSELAKMALRKIGRESTDDEHVAERLATRIAELDAAARGVLPQIEQQLPLRGGPLREHWEARGPGLLRGVARLTNESISLARADVILVHPALGGAGESHWPYQSVRIEAMLTNPLPNLPEVVRLGWLLAQLQFDHSSLAETIPADRVSRVARLAMLPPVLKAAEDVELARCDRATIELACEAWRVGGAEKFDRVEALMHWWETYVDSRTSWAEAMLSQGEVLSTEY